MPTPQPGDDPLATAPPNVPPTSNESWRTAEGPLTPAPAVTPTGHTRIRCPFCNNPIQLADDRSDEVLCPICGSNFRVQDTRLTTTNSSMRQLGKFQLLERIGVGGFGAVWRARDVELGRIVALKIPHTGLLTSKLELERFHREARAAAQLRHPGIVTVHEVATLEGLPTIVSDFIQGVPLRELLQVRRLTFRESAALLADVAEALDYAHQMGAVHRDIKPANIIIERCPAGTREEACAVGKPLVLDFGLALRQEAEITMTLEGQILGTPAYMSPEQATGQGHKVDGRCDVYSLGVMLFELLTGELPFRGSKAMLLHQVIHEEPRPPRRINDKIPRDLEVICLKAMSKLPAQRYATARDLAEDLRRFLKDEPIKARPPSLPARVWRWCRRHPLAAGVAASLVAALLSLVAFVQTRPAYLDVRVTPADAEVLLDGLPLDLNEGHALIESDPGKHELQVTAAGYLPHGQPVILARGRDNTVLADVRLEASFGYLRVNSNAEGALVEFLDKQNRVVARGITPFSSPRLPSGDYRLIVSKELFTFRESQQATVPTGERMGVVTVNLKLDGAITQSEALLRFMLKESETVDFGGFDDPQMTLGDMLEYFSDRYELSFTIDGQGGSKERLKQKLAGLVPSLRGSSLQSAIQCGLDQFGLTYVPYMASLHRAGFEVVDPESAAKKRFVILYRARDLFTDSKDAQVNQLVAGIRQFTGKLISRNREKEAVIEFLPSSQAVQVEASWPTQREVNRYLTEWRKMRRPAGKSGEHE